MLAYFMQSPGKHNPMINLNCIEWLTKFFSNWLIVNYVEDAYTINVNSINSRWNWFNEEKLTGKFTLVWSILIGH